MADTSNPTPTSRDAPQTSGVTPSQVVASSIAPDAHNRSSGDTVPGKRPKDARLIHMILANMGVNAYQERVPVQLLDFCYRYTSSTLQDALHLTSEFTQNVSGTGKIASNNSDMNHLNLQALRLSIASKTHYQFSPSLPRQSMADLASEKNRVALPPLGKDWGLRLPPERYCLTGMGYSLREEWDSEGEESTSKGGEGTDIVMEDGATRPDSDEEDDRMEDVFGHAQHEGR